MIGFNQGTLADRFCSLALRFSDDNRMRADPVAFDLPISEPAVGATNEIGR